MGGGVVLPGAEGAARVGGWSWRCCKGLGWMGCGDICLCICKEFTIFLTNFMFPFSFRWRKSACGFFSRMKYVIHKIAVFISSGSFLSILFVPQWIIAVCKFLGISPFCSLHRTFCILSPPTPKFNA